MKTIIRLTAILALMLGVCSAQMIIQTQSAGTTNGTFKRYFVLNCVSGLTCSVSGSTLSMTGSGGLPSGLAFASPELDVSSAGNGNGILGLKGTTSGACTQTGSATSTTITDNCLRLIPDGSSSIPGIAFANSPTSGIWNNLGATQGNIVINAAIQHNFMVGGNGYFVMGSNVLRDNASASSWNRTNGLITAALLQMSGGTTPIAGYFSAGSTVVASLPAAAAGNKGQMISVSDSTAVSAEGQTCVGSGAVTALAFSNGTVWKCF